MDGCVMFAAAWLGPAAGAAGYYAGLVGLGRRRPAVPPGPADWPAVGVLIPAHNEAIWLGRTLASVRACGYPAGRLRVLVVADNCTDRTAAVARRAGVGVVERTDPARRGKGYAVERGVAELLAAGVDGVLILDADCDLPAGGLHRLAAELAAGAGAVQAARLPRSPVTGRAGWWRRSGRRSRTRSAPAGPGWACRRPSAGRACCLAGPC